MTEPTVDSLSFEDALVQLEGIVSELERGDIPLEASIEHFERGMALSRRCEDRLNEAERKVAMLVRRGNRVVSVDVATGEEFEEVADAPTDLDPPKVPVDRGAPSSSELRPQSPPAASGAPSTSELRRQQQAAREAGGPRQAGLLDFAREIPLPADDDIPF